MMYDSNNFKGVLFMNNILSILNNSKNEQFNDIYNNMSSFQKSIIDEMKVNPNKFYDYSLSDLLFDFDKSFIEFLLNLEIDFYLNDNIKNGIFNKKNGSTKDIHIIMGNKDLNFNRPRLRKEKDFDSILIPKRTRIINDLTDNIILLYSKNNSVNDIKDILAAMFNINISTATISKLANSISDNVFNWRNKELKKCYFTINIDCTYISIKDSKSLTSHKIPIYLAIGTDLSGHKEIVGIYLGNEDQSKHIIDSLYNQDIAESKSFWLTVFNDLKDRGLEKILFICSDGLTGIEDAIHQTFPSSIYQRCIVHLVRNLQSYTNKKNRKIVTLDFKKIYSANNKNLSLLYFNEFLEKYQNDKVLIKKVNEYYQYILPLFDVPENIRKYIYTNNIAESANSKIKRGFYGRGALPNPESAINIIYFNLHELEIKWAKTKVNNWDNIFKELSTLYYDVIKDYLS